MAIEITVPAVGESITEVQIGEWYVQEGVWVAQDKEIVGLETDKATFDVPAPTGGTITRILIKAGEMAAVGDVIGYFETSEAPEGAEQPAANPAPAASQAPAPPASAGAASGHVMPAAAREAAQSGVDPASVAGTGPGGRILKEDVQRAVGNNAGPENMSVLRQSQTVPMTPIRKRIAERLVEAQHNAALLTTFNECDMSAVMNLRKHYKDQFIKKHDVKLGFMSFFVKAVVYGLNQVPQLASQIQGTNLFTPNYYDIGVAVGTGKGLVVPVLRNAERMSFAEIEQTIGEFGQRAQAGKVTLQEMEGGCFTITNGGVYGSLLSTPIVNPPQSGVLGMHNIVERPIAVNGQVEIRPMMYLALTYDHRVVDGREAVTFLRLIKEVIEEPSRMLIEI